MKNIIKIIMNFLRIIKIIKLKIIEAKLVTVIMNKKLISCWTIFVNRQSCFEVICENSQSELRPPRQMTANYLHAADAALKYEKLCIQVADAY